MMYKEFLAASFAFMEKKKYRTATLLVPPPIPRNEEMIPRKMPITMVDPAFLTCLDESLFLLQT